MAVYRCAACGSPNVKKIENQNGFSYSKAMVGTAVFGTVGAVAGINGKKTSAYACPDCGLTMPLPMDTVKKDIIDVVLTAPDMLAPIMYPNIFSDYPKLRKAPGQPNGHSAGAATSKPYANPLDISEKDFRSAARKFSYALQQLTYFHYGAQKITPDHKDYILENGLSAIKDMAAICEGFRSLRTIVYGLPAFPSLIMDNDPTESGLERRVLATAVLAYIVIENGGQMQMHDLYEAIVFNRVYHQDITLLYGDKIQSTLEVNHFFRPTPISAEEEELGWIEVLNNRAISLYSSHGFWLKTNTYPVKPQNLISMRFKLNNESLYIRNPISGDVQFEKDMPELACNIRCEEENAEQVKKHIEQLTNTAPSQIERDAAATIEKLRRSNTEIETQISSLHKKIFGKKKAALTIQSLGAEINANHTQITEKQKEIDDAKKRRELDAQKKIDAEQKNLTAIQQKLATLLEQKREYLAAIPEWICLAGPDAEE